MPGAHHQFAPLAVEHDNLRDAAPIAMNATMLGNNRPELGIGDQAVGPEPREYSGPRHVLGP